MEPDEYAIMYRVEDDNWWYQGMAAISRKVLQHWLPSQANLRILDAGCGTGGAMQSFLSDYGRVVGLDFSFLALDYCRLRAAPFLTCASVSNLPFPIQSFELVTSFDVLYARSVADVSAALTEFARVLIPGGHLLLRLPAYDWLRGQHDVGVHTARRFTRKGLEVLLKRAGFKVRHLSYANTFLFSIALVKRMIERIWPNHVATSDLAIRLGPLNAIFGALLRLEAPLVAGPGLPFGLSVVAVGQKL